MVGVDGCRKIVPGCQQERKPNSGMPVNVYSTANVLFGKHLRYIETVLVLSKGNKINRRMSGTLKNDILKWCHLCQRRSQDFFWGGPIFRDLRRPTRFGGGGVVSEIFSGIAVSLADSVGGGG